MIHRRMQTCECGVLCKNRSNLERHRATKSHELNLKCGEVLVADEDGSYRCNTCSFSTLYKGNYRDHILSNKHKSNVNKPEISRTKRSERKKDDEVEDTHSEITRTKVEEIAMRAATKALSEVKPVSLSDVLELFLKAQQQQLKSQEQQHQDILKILGERVTAAQQCIALNPQQQTVTMENNQSHSQNTSNTNSHNKKFNLNFFLNEECKNAQNLSDFVKSVVISMEDLEHLGEVGFTEGMTKILTKAMKNKRKTDRPMHCTDVKRDTIYIRKNNAWEKDSDNEETTTAIKHIAHKNMKALNEWSTLHPDSMEADTENYTRWQDLSRKTYSSDPKVIKKLVHHLASMTAIDRQAEEEEEEEDY